MKQNGYIFMYKTHDIMYIHQPRCELPSMPIAECSVTVKNVVFPRMILCVFKEFQVTKFFMPVRC